MTTVQKVKVWNSLTAQQQLDCICYCHAGSVMTCMFHVTIYGDEDLVQKAVDEGLQHNPLLNPADSNNLWIDCYYEAWEEIRTNH